jgi:hypothetical protein
LIGELDQVRPGISRAPGESIILPVLEFGYTLLVDAQFGFSSTDFLPLNFLEKPSIYLQ